MMQRSFWNHCWIVLSKELLDALRDRRTLLRLMGPALLMGPLLLMALSGLISSLEERAEQREVMVAGIENAPTLRNFLERQTYVIKAAPADYEAQLRATRLLVPVLVIGADFEAELLAGSRPTVELVSDSANQRAGAGMPALQRLLAGFNRETASLNLALRGISTELLQPVAVEERDLASVQARASRITSIIPMFIIMAVLYGALTSALDSTAGERERGSLEPLAMNPASSLSLVLGKWGAVASVGMLVALLNCFSFLPAQWLLRSDTLQAMFQFGVREALMFLVVLLPFAAALSAVLMGVAIRCKSFKEAQASATFVILGVSLLPLMTVFNQSGEAPWHLWVPALAQNTLMTRVLKGEDFTPLQWFVPLLVCVLLTVAGLWFVANHLRHAAVK